MNASNVFVGVLFGISASIFFSLFLDHLRQKERELQKKEKRLQEKEAWEQNIEYRLGYVEEIVRRIPIVWADAKRPEGEEK